MPDSAEDAVFRSFRELRKAGKVFALRHSQDVLPRVRVVSEGFPGRPTVWLVVYEDDNDYDLILRYEQALPLAGGIDLT